MSAFAHIAGVLERVRNNIHNNSSKNLLLLLLSLWFVLLLLRDWGVGVWSRAERVPGLRARHAAVDRKNVQKTQFPKQRRIRPPRRTPKYRTPPAPKKKIKLKNNEKTSSERVELRFNNSVIVVSVTTRRRKFTIIINTIYPFYDYYYSFSVSRVRHDGRVCATVVTIWEIL